MLRNTIRLLSLLVLATAITVQVSAQATNGSVRGTISDQTGAMLPKATIHIKHVATNVERTLSARSDGTYTVDNLQPGEYELRVEATGFKKELMPVTILTGGNIEVNFSLTVGSSTETVVVTAAGAQLNTSDYKVDGVSREKSRIFRSMDAARFTCFS